MIRTKCPQWVESGRCDRYLTGMNRNQKLWLRLGWLVLVAVIIAVLIRDLGAVRFIVLGASFAAVSMRLSGWAKWTTEPLPRPALVSAMGGKRTWCGLSKLRWTKAR